MAGNFQTATGDEPAFKALINEVFQVLNKNKELPEGECAPFRYELHAILKWRRVLAQEAKHIASEVKPTVHIPVDSKHWPGPVQSMLHKWACNPKNISPHVREDEYGLLNDADLDIVA